MMIIDNFLNQYNDFDIRQTHDARYVELLNKLGAENALCSIDSDFNKSDIEYDLVNEKLRDLRMESLLYLKRILQ